MVSNNTIKTTLFGMTENAAARRTTKLSFHKQKGESFTPAANRKVHIQLTQVGQQNGLLGINKTPVLARQGDSLKSCQRSKFCV